MKKEKIVIFDWGGVIESHTEGEYNGNEAAIDLLKELNIRMKDNEIIEKFNKCCYASHSKNNIEEVYNIYKNNFNLECDISEFINKYKKHFSQVQYYKNIVDLAHSLKEKCYIGILSNLNALDKDRIDSQMELNKFDYVWLSFELECDKPNKKIYDIVETNINIKPNNILFIDDLETNLEIPKLKGWNTCRATGLEFNKIKDSIDEFLNK